MKNWPSWDSPSEDVMLALAKTITKYIKFLSPAIILAIVKDNNANFENWKMQLDAKNIEWEKYLWIDGACMFPGVRRHEGKLEINKKHKNITPDDELNALYIDDNDFPKHLWAYIFTGVKFRKSGPKNYQLAHILDYKKYKNRLKEELGLEEELILPGLFTSATNICYVPTAFLKLTDFNDAIRKLIFYKSLDLYSNICKLLPSKVNIPEQKPDDIWNVKNFEWAETVGDILHINEFINFRNDKMERLF